MVAVSGNRKHSTQELRDVAYPCFQHQLEMIRSWQQRGLIGGDNPLRTSQVIWGTVHGIAKLFIDGIYTDAAQIEEVSPVRSYNVSSKPRLTRCFQNSKHFIYAQPYRLLCANIPKLLIPLLIPLQSNNP